MGSQAFIQQENFCDLLFAFMTEEALKNHCGESGGLNDRVHGILCRYSDKTCKKIKLYFH